MQSEDRLRRIERLTELPLLILAVALIPLLVLPSLVALDERVRDSITIADWLIWAVFAVDYSAKLAVAPARVAYVRRHWLEALMVVLPFLRPLRVLRAVRVLRVLAALGFNVQLLQEMASRRGMRLVAASILLVLVAGATLVLLAERQSDAATIDSFGDALWWAFVTMTTVGYGDHYPVTPMGRGVAGALMLFGIAALSAATASIAAYLVQGREQVDLADVLAELRAVRAELDGLRAERG